MIPYGKHSLDGQDIASVVDVLENHYLTQGEMVPRFERALAEYCTAKHCVTVNSATSGLHIACLAAGVGAGDWVWTSPISFVASANCARYCGANVDFVDVDESHNISVTHLAARLARAKVENCLPKAIILVHFAGNSCDMQQIAALTQPLGIRLIEDAAHGLGGEYQGRKIGCCQYSDMAVLSFHPVKSITSAEGGAVLTNDSELQKRLLLLARHGVTRDPDAMTNRAPVDQGAWYYQQQVLGFNYRLSDVHAALGLSQLGKLDAFIARRAQLASQYDVLLADLPLKLPKVATDRKSAWHLYMVQVTGNRQQIFSRLRQAGIGVNVHYIPIHLQPYYRQFGFKEGDFPQAEGFYANALTLPLYPDLSDSQQQQVVAQLAKVLGEQ